MLFRDTLISTIETIGIVSPSFFIEKQEKFETGIKYLQEQGYKLRFGSTVFNREYNTTGTAMERAEDVNRMFMDSDIDLIMATDGGCRAIELLEYLDYDAIKNNPKPICGFSDITHILLAIYSKTQNPCIHGMDLMNGFGQPDSCMKEKNVFNFFQTLTKNRVEMNFEKTRVLKRGSGSGVAIGGWLNAIHNLVGTKFFPQNEKMVLFWEAIDEEPNRINMMLWSLRLSGLYERLNAMVIGRLTNCVEKEYFDCIPSIEDMILEACKGYNFPIIIGAPFGHGCEMSAFKQGDIININTEEFV